jgi:hypothetical protein
MKQIWPNYSYSPTTNVLTLTGLNIDVDQLLLVSAPERGRIMYNFADSTVTASAFTAGANTGLTLVASTAGLTTTAALVIYYDDQLQSTAITISNFPASQAVTFSDASLTNTQLRASAVTIGGTVTVGNSVTISSLPAISGVVTANVLAYDESNDAMGELRTLSVGSRGGALEVVGANTANAIVANGLPCVPIFGSVTIGSALPAGTNRIGVVTIGGGTVTIGAGTAQIGSVTASISGTVPISISSVTVGNSVTIGSLPSISGTVTANTFAVQGTAVTTSNFTSTTASTVLASFNATREVLTIFNEGAGNLHIAPGATCTTIAYQVRLSAGDYYEVPNHQTTITHSAVFATAGTARVTEVT